MEFTHMVSPANPYHRRDREAAIQRSLWASFRYYLDRCDEFAVTYWPGDRTVEPLLQRGFRPGPTRVSPEACELRGRLTPELRELLWGRGEGPFPWWAVDLYREGRLVYNWTEHEQMALFVAAEADLQDLFAAGVDPAVIEDLRPAPASTRCERACGESPRAEATGATAHPLPRHLRTAFTHRLDRPTREEWVRALHLAASRADRFGFVWRAEPPGRNGWSSAYGREKLLPHADGEEPAALLGGWVDCLELTGPLTPAALDLLSGEPPTGLPDLEHFSAWEEGDSPPAPWWDLLLYREGMVIFRSADNGAVVYVALEPDQVAVLDRPPGRLVDLVAQLCRSVIWAALVKEAGPPGSDLASGLRLALASVFGPPAQRNPWRVRQLSGEPIFHCEWRHADRGVVLTLTAHAEALDRLAQRAWPHGPSPGDEQPDPSDPAAREQACRLLESAPREGHLLVECAGEEVVVRTVPAPPDFPRPPGW